MFQVGGAEGFGFVSKDFGLCALEGEVSAGGEVAEVEDCGVGDDGVDEVGEVVEFDLFVFADDALESGVLVQDFGEETQTLCT